MSDASPEPRFKWNAERKLALLRALALWPPFGIERTAQAFAIASLLATQFNAAVSVEEVRRTPRSFVRSGLTR